ncbi:hypothetical protein EXIGLDRAFT_160738 [Exidia glandulosa HHB12029]|uniref:Uncharacterized protein n=1 Tax=Exidia glandulosa HHB12029 TaxID=1314781 RepID=A0A166A6Z1_EXIGL|nr:hypothetical protein EXIGLDRAFT_160738 [Exidia glandulosa HHB12029]
MRSTSLVPSRTHLNWFLTRRNLDARSALKRASRVFESSKQGPVCAALTVPIATVSVCQSQVWRIWAGVGAITVLTVNCAKH